MQVRTAVVFIADQIVSSFLPAASFADSVVAACTVSSSPSSLPPIDFDISQLPCGHQPTCFQGALSQSSRWLARTALSCTQPCVRSMSFLLVVLLQLSPRRASRLTRCCGTHVPARTLSLVFFLVFMFLIFCFCDHCLTNPLEPSALIVTSRPDFNCVMSLSVWARLAQSVRNLCRVRDHSHWSVFTMADLAHVEAYNARSFHVRHPWCLGCAPSS